MNERVETKIVAFLDILGFRNIVKNKISNMEFIKKLEKSLEFSDKVLSGRGYIAKNIVFKMFSDCICASVPNTKDDILNFLIILQLLQLKLISDFGVFIRGGLSKGRHYESLNLVFSEGLIESYEIESRDAIYPRIVISDELAKSILGYMYTSIEVELWKGIPETIELNPKLMILQDIDGKYFLNFMEYLCSYDRIHAAQQVAWEIQKSIEVWVSSNKALDPKITSKQMWIVRYFNKFIEEWLGYKDEINEQLLFSLKNE